MVRRGAGGNGEKCQPSGLSAEGGNDSEFRQTTSGAHGCAGRADRLPRGKPPASGEKSQLCRMRTPAGGHDAPTPAREWDLLSHGALTLFFRWRRTLLTQEGSSCQSHKSDDPNRMPFSFRQRAVLLSIHKDSLFSLTCKEGASSTKPTKR